MTSGYIFGLNFYRDNSEDYQWQEAGKHIGFFWAPQEPT
jgi:hypothetical protein